MYKKTILILGILVFMVTTGYARDYKYIDTHLHYLNFVEQTQGFAALIKKLDEQNVDKSVIFGMPYNIVVTEKSVNNPTYYLSDDSKVFWYGMTDILLMDDYLKLSPDQQKRFYPFICGANTNNINSAQEIEHLLDMYPGKWKGIGELMFRHDYLSWKAGEDIPTPNNAAADAIFNLAARRNLPVILHQDMTSMRSTMPIYKFEMETALQKHPTTHIIWAHVGKTYNTNVDNLIGIADELLEKYPNLSFDLSWIVFEEDIDKDDASLQAWAALLQKYPKRFLIGTDTVGNFDNYNIRKYDRLLDLVDDNTARAVSHDNFLRAVHEL